MALALKFWPQLQLHRPLIMELGDLDLSCGRCSVVKEQAFSAS